MPEEMIPVKKSGVVDGGDKIAAETEGDKALTVGGGEEQKEQKGRRRSVLELISGQKAVSSKVTPAGAMKKGFDQKEFVREMKRRGTISV